MSYTYNSGVPGRPKNVNKRCDQPERAPKLRAKQRKQWLQENARVIQAYNLFVEANGTFSDSVRKF